MSRGEPCGPLTLAVLVQAMVSSAVPAGQAEPREEGLEHHQVAAVEGQVAGEGAQVDCQDTAVGGAGPDARAGDQPGERGDETAPAGSLESSASRAGKLGPSHPCCHPARDCPDPCALAVRAGWARTHWSTSECFCRKGMAAGALQVMYLWVNCTNLLMKGARWREDFL